MKLSSSLLLAALHAMTSSTPGLQRLAVATEKSLNKKAVNQQAIAWRLRAKMKTGAFCR